MQTIFRLFGSRQRPILFVAPLVFSHHKNAHRFLAGKFVGLSLQKKVIPLEQALVVVVWSGRAKIYLADFSLIRGASVAADFHQEMLAVARGFAARPAFQQNVIAQRAAEKDVVPSGDVKDRHLDVSVVLFDRDSLPICVIAW